jgi:hypothetical protein
MEELRQRKMRNKVIPHFATDIVDQLSAFNNIKNRKKYSLVSYLRK